MCRRRQNKWQAKKVSNKNGSIQELMRRCRRVQRGGAKFTAGMGAHKTNIMPLFAVVVKLEGAK